jgi:hypothetical protein
MKRDQTHIACPLSQMQRAVLFRSPFAPQSGVDARSESNRTHSLKPRAGRARATRDQATQQICRRGCVRNQPNYPVTLDASGGSNLLPQTNALQQGHAQREQAVAQGT